MDKKNFSKTDLSRLGNYLLGGLGIATSIATQQADAAVVAFTFSPSVITTGSGYIEHFNSTNGSVQTVGRTSYIEMRGQFYHTGPSNIGRDLAKFFTAGTVIGSASNGTLGSAFFHYTFNSPLDFTADQAGFVAFKTNTNHFGYADVSWNEAALTLTINSAFVESVANTPITIIPEPSVAGLLALGAVAAARSRRREKKAA